MTLRDDTRDAIAALAALAADNGLNIEDLRKESRSELSLAHMLQARINSPVPTIGRERLRIDDFAGQVYNGTNSDFTISQEVLGENINVVWFDFSAPLIMWLPRTTNPAPSGFSFYFDGLFTVRVGTAPDALDGLGAAYIARL